jgi:ssDNA-binding replication factor A large subunit
MASEIGTLRYGLSGVSFKARVVQKSAVRAVTSKDGTPLLVCDVTLSDGTGEIPLAVWNNQIGGVAKGDLIQIENARVRSFRGQIQLFLGRKTGVLTVLEHARLFQAS